MPRRCTVCDHSERHSIDEALVSGAAYRSVAKRFGLSESAVYRHKTEHLPAHLLKAREVEEVAQADARNLLLQLRSYVVPVLEIHLGNQFSFSGMEAAATFMDQPLERERLLHRTEKARLAEIAIEYHGYVDQGI
jgi:transposase-like protein